jgi:hypothetical protein
MSTPTPTPAPTPIHADRTTEHTPVHHRGWAWAGVLAGVCGLAMFLVAPTVVEYSDAVMADNAVLAEQLNDSELVVWAVQVLTSLAAGLLVVFGAGLRRRLAEQEPVGSLLPNVAAAGALLTAAMCLVGGGVGTELFWYLSEDVASSDPDTVAGALTIFNTVPWVWAGLGLSAGAVALASLRHGSVQRWIGWTSAGLAALVALTQVLPVQYIALLPGSIWLVVGGIGLTRRERLG